MSSFPPGSPGGYSPEPETRRRDSLNDLQAEAEAEALAEALAEAEGEGEGDGDGADEASTDEPFKPADDA